MNFTFMILDEGHLIRNHKTKTACAVKCINARHKFILTGTPIQNNILEMWAIFDFLMPGYLGDEEFFKKVSNHLIRIFKKLFIQIY